MSTARDRLIGFGERRRGPLVLLGLLALALAVYLPYAVKAGWYYDDWAFYSEFKDAGGSWASRFSNCTSHIAGGRKLTCLYHVTEYQLLGSHRTGYHLVAIAFLVVMAGLAYVVLRRCRVGWPWAALVAALLVVFPGSDTTRLWPTAAIGQYVIVLELVGVLLVLSALRRGTGRWAVVLHAVSGLLFLVAMLTYEIAVPLVALNGIVYWAARRDRAALWRGGADLALAAGFVVYRLAFAPPAADTGFTVHRTLHGDLSRARTLIDGVWKTWHESYLPGALGVAGIVGVLVAAAVLAWRDREARRRLRPWAGLLVGGVAIAGAAMFAFLTANDYYVPQITGTFNRINLPGSIAYGVVFVALLGLGYEVIRRLVPVPLAATLAVAVVAAGSAWHQLGVSSDHKRAWEVSWSEQKSALAGYREALRGVPATSRVIGLGAPIWERGFIPVFAASWDLAGAIAYETHVRPAVASPLFPAIVCGPRGLVLDNAPMTPYHVPGQPLYFANAQRGAAVLVSSKTACDGAIARWGRPPFWGRTITG